MRHRVKTKKLNRHQGARKGLDLSLTRALILNSSINTTVAKAKYVKPKAEKLVTYAKKGENLSTRRILLSRLNNEKQLVDKLYDIAKKYKNTNGGYLKILKAQTRAGDNAKMAKVMWVEKQVPAEQKAKVAGSVTTKTKKSSEKVESKPKKATKKVSKK